MMKGFIWGHIFGETWDSKPIQKALPQFPESLRGELLLRVGITDWWEKAVPPLRYSLSASRVSEARHHGGPLQVNPTFLDSPSKGSQVLKKKNSIPRQRAYEDSKTSQTTAWFTQGEGCFQEAAKGIHWGHPGLGLNSSGDIHPLCARSHVNWSLFAIIPTNDIRLIILTSEGSFKICNTSCIHPGTQ